MIYFGRLSPRAVQIRTVVMPREDYAFHFLPAAEPPPSDDGAALGMPRAYGGVVGELIAQEIQLCLLSSERQRDLRPATAKEVLLEQAGRMLPEARARDVACDMSRQVATGAARAIRMRNISISGRAGGRLEHARGSGRTQSL